MARDKLTQLLTEMAEARVLGADLDPFDLPAVIAGRKLIADTVGQLPVVAVRDGRPREDQPAIVRRPDPAEPLGRTLERTVNDLTRHGNAWWLTTSRDATGWPASIMVLPAREVLPQVDPYGRLLTVAWRDRTLRVGRDVTHIPLTSDPGPLGTSPLLDAADTLHDLAAVLEFAGSYFEAGSPSLAIMVKQRLAEGQAQALKAQAMLSWRRRHEPAVIDQDADLKAIGTTAETAQLSAMLDWVDAVAARLLGIPPSLLNTATGSSLTYATTESEFRKWLAVGLGGYLTRIEAAFNDLTPRGTNCRLDTSELLRSDFQARAQAYQMAVGGPWLTPDEARAREGLAPLGSAVPAAVVTPNVEAPA